MLLGTGVELDPLFAPDLQSYNTSTYVPTVLTYCCLVEPAYCGEFAKDIFDLWLTVRTVVRRNAHAGRVMVFSRGRPSWFLMD